MCGLVGYFSLNQSIENEAMVSMLNDLKHRGPDQQAYWISPSRHVGLGQTRLSINDLSHISLPLTNKTKTVHVIANAEIYNHHELRRELEQRGHRFQTNSDIEVIPYLYEEYGINFLHKLRGEFSFIIWDENQKTLFAVRDRFGIKPLYYATVNNSIYFASELPPLLKITASWDMSRVMDFTIFGSTHDKTLFQNIYHVPPASYLTLHQSTRSITPYWDLNYSCQNELSLPDTVEKIRAKLIDSVNVRIHSDVPVACYLSGGLDSSTLLGIAATQAQAPVDAFSIAFEDKMVDESNIAEKVCDRSGAKFHKLLVSESDLVENFEAVVRHTCSPVSNTAGVARYLLSKFAREAGYKAVLSGEGADEIFLGYFGSMLEALEDPKLSTDYLLTPEQKSALLQNLPVDRGGVLPEGIQLLQTAFNHIPSWVKTMSYFNQLHRSVLHPDILHSQANYNSYLSFANSIATQNKFNNFDNVQISSYTWIKSFFPNTMLNFIGDRAEMANSIEARQPFLDHELVELMATIPTAMKITGGIDKYLLREAAKPFISKEVYERKKFMFQAPPLKLSESSPLFNTICEIILSKVSSAKLYDQQKVLNLVNMARYPDVLTREQKFELSYTLTNIASILILNDTYRLT